MIIAGKGAFAHVTNITALNLAISGANVAYQVRVTTHDLAVALGVETDLVTPVLESAFIERSTDLNRYLGQRLTARAQDRPCEAAAKQKTTYVKADDALIIEGTMTCPETVQWLTVSYLLFFDIDASHRALGRVTWPGGGEDLFFDRNLTVLDLVVENPEPQLSWRQRFNRLFLLGVEHILTGYDHLLFLVALLVVTARFWRLFTVVTAFTVAHSLTLALAWFGVIDLPTRLVESLIALSIVYVAIENILDKGAGHRWLLAAGFGLVHGLGFYRVLRDLDQGESGVITTLLSFNLGVEAGQLVIVAVLYAPLIWWAQQQWYRRSAIAGSAVILAIAGWWLIERVFIA